MLREILRNYKRRKRERRMIKYVFIFFLLLTGCNSVCPDKTTVEVGVTETDSKNDKFQEKKSLTQTFKWGKKKCGVNAK